MAPKKGKMASVPEIRSSECILCGVCEAVCPKTAIVVFNGKTGVDSSRCSGCKKCTEACPMGAIS